MVYCTIAECLPFRCKNNNSFGLGITTSNFGQRPGHFLTWRSLILSVQTRSSFSSTLLCMASVPQDMSLILPYAFPPGCLPFRQAFELSERSVECWERVLQIRGHSSDVMDLAWSPSSSVLQLATCSLDGTVRVWDVANKGSNVRSFVSISSDHLQCIK